MSTFQTYFQLGVTHILDLAGYDHILFVVVLCALYPITAWKRILILITAFTVGHSLTLALATLGIIVLPSEWVEFCIPLTILITAFSNILRPTLSGKHIQLNYVLAAVFGLIHGMGFSNYLRAILGREQSLFEPLLAFNLGLELGQIVILLFYSLFSWLLVRYFRVKQRELTIVISAVIAGMAFVLMLEAKFW